MEIVRSSREPLSPDRCDGFEVENGRSGFVGFFQIEREVEGSVVEVVGVDEGLVDRLAVFGEVWVWRALRKPFLRSAAVRVICTREHGAGNRKSHSAATA